MKPLPSMQPRGRMHLAVAELRFSPIWWEMARALPLRQFPGEPIKQRSKEWMNQV